MLSTLIIVLLLQTTAPEAAAAPAAEEAPAAQAQAAAPQQVSVPPAGMMDCEYNRATRVRLCRTSTGEMLQCRRERVLGSRFKTNVCFTYREGEEVERDSRAALDHQQRITTPDQN